MSTTIDNNFLKILIVTPYFYPENFKINDLVTELQRRGHSLSVLTPIPNYPEGKYFKGYSLFNKRYQFYKNISIYRVPVISRGSGNRIRLFLNYISFVIFSILPIRKILRKKYNIIFVYSPSPATVGIPAIIIKKILQVPLIFWVHDLWPESVKSAGKLNSDIIPKLINPIIKWLYRNSDKVLVSSKGFIKPIIKNGGKEKDILYFPQWAEPIFNSGNKEIIEIPNVPKNSFKIMFAGNIGEAQDFSSILETAKKLKFNKKIHWIIVGGGRKEKWVKEKINKYQLQNVFHMVGRFPLEKMPSFYEYADTMLISLKKEYIFSLTVPAKAQSYLASGKPILAMIDGATATLINESKSGLACAAESPDQLAKNILKMCSLNNDEIKQMGVNAYNFSQKEFNRERLISILEELFYKVSYQIK